MSCVLKVSLIFGMNFPLKKKITVIVRRLVFSTVSFIKVRPISGALALDQGGTDVIAGLAVSICGRIRGCTRTDSCGLRAARGICAGYPFWAR